MGLLSDEYDKEQTQEVAVTITEALGQKAIELARADGKPFTIAWSEESCMQEPVLNRPVERLRLFETVSSPWLGVEVPGSDTLEVLQRPGLNYLMHVVTMFAARKQAASEAKQPTSKQRRFHPVA